MLQPWSPCRSPSLLPARVGWGRSRSLSTPHPQRTPPIRFKEKEAAGRPLCPTLREMGSRDEKGNEDRKRLKEERILKRNRGELEKEGPRKREERKAGLCVCVGGAVRREMREMLGKVES